VQLNGVVSYVNQAKNRYVLSARGVSLLVAAASTSVPPLPVAGRELKLQLALPAPGATAAALAKGLLEQTRTDAGAAKPPLELTGVITSIDDVAHKVTISADGQNTSGDTIVLAVPTSIKLKGLIAQEAVVAHATIGADGGYSFYGADADTGVSAADDPTNQLGDFVPKKSTRKHAAAGRVAAPAPPLTLFGLTSGLSGYPALRQGANAFLEPSSAGASSG